MIQKSALLTFPKELIGIPVISHLIRDIGVEVNILQASITPASDGRMFVILQGQSGDVDKAVDYLIQTGVKVVLPASNLIYDSDKCVHCTACVGQCPSNAFSVDRDTAKVVFDGDSCIACELCIPACSYNAVESIGKSLGRKGAR